MSDFIGRERELEQLRGFVARGALSLATVRGRRRIGKSTLLREALHGAAHIYHQAQQMAPREALLAFQRDAQRDLLALGVRLPLAATSWPETFELLQLAADRLEGLSVAIDEFPYLAQREGEIESAFQRIVDDAQRHGTLKIILCGSSLSYMRRLQDGHQPLHGRSGLNIALGPLGYREATERFSAWGLEDRVRLHALIGGVPLYLQLFDPELSLAENYMQQVMTPNAPLHEEPINLLRSEVESPPIYAQLLAAISGGQNKLGEIVGRSPDVQSSSQATYYLQTLVELGLIGQHRSLTDPPKARNTRYAVLDPMMRSWHHFVRPWLSQLQAGNIQEVWDTAVAPGLDTFTSLHFETLCRTWTAEHLPGLLGPGGREVGSIWPTRSVQDAEIDVAAQGAAGWLTGECKWTRGAFDQRDLAQLLRAEGLHLTGKAVMTRLLFTRSGVHRGLILPGKTQVVNLERLFGQVP